MGHPHREIYLKKNSPRLMAHLEAILAAIEVLALGPPVDAVYGELTVALKRGGQPIGANDMLIAPHAKALGRTVVTDNEREFSRIVFSNPTLLAN